MLLPYRQVRPVQGLATGSKYAVEMVPGPPVQVARQALVALVALRWPGVPAPRVRVPGAGQALDNPAQFVLDVAAGKVVVDRVAAAQVRVGRWAWTRGSSYHGHNWHRTWRGQNCFLHNRGSA